jgi:hypothetical protein
MARLPCAICGMRPVKCRDHVPPKGLFSSPKPTNLVTVGTCIECNNGASKTDKEFRAYLGLLVGGHSEDGTIFLRQDAMQTLRNDAKLMKQVTSGLSEVPFTMPDGTISTRTGFHWPERVHRVTIDRIARGLYFHHTRQILGSRVEVHTGFLHSLTQETYDQTNDFQSGTIGESKFVYRFGIAPESPLHSLWVFQFYGAHWASAHTNPVDQPWPE